MNSAIALGLGASVCAQAQVVEPGAKKPDSSAPEADSPQEIVVTARRVKERLRDIPASVTALRGEDLLAVSSIQDLTGKVPGLKISAAGGNNPILALRGQGNRLGAEPVVGLFEDGVAIPRMAVSVLSSLDPARIEASVGPQNALYGRASLTGAINFVSADPTYDRTGFVEAGYGSSSTSGDRLYDAKAVVSGALGSDDVLGRLVLLRGKREGYVLDPTTGNRAGGYDRTAARLKVLFAPTDKLTIKLTGTVFSDNSPWPTVLSAEPQPPLGALISSAQSPLPSAAAAIAAATVFPSSIWESRYVRPQYVKIDFSSLVSDIRLDTPIGEFASLTSYQKAETDLSVSVDRTSLGFADSRAHQFDNRLSQEFRLSGRSGKVSYLGGLSFFEAKNTMGGNDGEYHVENPTLAYYPYSAQYDALNLAGTYIGWNNKTRASGMFGQVGMDVTPQLNVTGAIRYNSEKIFGTTSFYNLTRAGVLATILAPYYREATFNSVTGNVNVSYKIAPDNMVYGSYSKGNSPGGLNSGASQAAAAATYAAQEVNAFELGLKSRLANGRVDLSVALFDNQYKNLVFSQTKVLPVPGGAPGQTTISAVFTNVAESYGRGLETTLSAALTEQWRASLLYTYLKTRVTKYSLGSPGAIDFTGAPILQSPENSIRAALTHTRKVGQGSLSVTGEVQYVSDFVNDYLGVPAGTAYPGRPGVPAGTTTSQVTWLVPLKGYALTNLTASYTIDQWQFRGYVRNLFNKQAFVAGAGSSPTVLASLVPGEPRTIELTVRRSF